jgi:hypothetical protein
MGRLARPLTNARSSFDEPFLDESGVTLSSGYQVRRLKCLLCISWASASVLAIALVVLLTRLRYTTSTAILNDEVYCTLIRFKYSLIEPLSDPVIAPAQGLIKYKNVVFTSGFGHERTEYQGPPTPERDGLWDELYGCK